MTRVDPRIKRPGVGSGNNSTPPRRKPGRTVRLGMAQTMAKTTRPAYERIDTREYKPASADLRKAFGPMQDRGEFTDWSHYPKED